MKLTGERMRVAKYTSTRELCFDIPADSWSGVHKYIVQYDARPNGRIYHAAGRCFRNLENVIQAAIHG